MGALGLTLAGAAPAAADGKGERPKAAEQSRAAKVVRTARVVRAVRPCPGARLGFAYETGQGVPQDYAFAAYWYSRGAECGDPRRPRQPRILRPHPQRGGVQNDLPGSHRGAAAGARVVATEGGRGPPRLLRLPSRDLVKPRTVAAGADGSVRQTE
jgi:hypothetical protein